MLTLNIILQVLCLCLFFCFILFNILPEIPGQEIFSPQPEHILPAHGEPIYLK